MPAPIQPTVHQLASSRVWRALAAVAASALCAAALLAAAALVRHGDLIRSVENGGDWYARSPGWYTTRGVYPTEHAPDGAPFAWAGGRVRIQIPQLVRDEGHELSVRVRSGRDAREPDAMLRVLVDGVDAAAVRAGADWQVFHVTIPPSRQTGAAVLIEAQDTFTPGPQDPRRLAFMVDRLELRATAGGRIAIGALTYAHVAAFAAAAALAVLLCGLPAWMAWPTGTASGLAAIALVLFDAAYLGGYSAVFLPLSIATVMLCAVGAVALRAAPEDLRRAAAAAIVLAVLVSIVRLAVFLHPAAPTSD
ncbi:MAG TPA: hypothetical protein VFJ02_15625, partial [Vicinamibacterales bacterium]|nr:hypothetical protein [Vicinamibacterales bacterium]